jgi:hypothetical protein
MTGVAHRTEYKRHELERRLQTLLDRQAEMQRIDWISSDDFTLAAWAAGK